MQGPITGKQGGTVSYFLAGERSKVAPMPRSGGGGGDAAAVFEVPLVGQLLADPPSPKHLADMCKGLKCPLCGLHATT